MALFGGKKEETPGLIGVDIGTTGIKAVEILDQAGKSQLGTYGQAHFKETEMTRGSVLTEPKSGGLVLKAIAEESGMKVRVANASLPSHEVFHAIFTVPPSKEIAQMEESARKRVSTLLPKPIDEMVLDILVIDRPEEKEGLEHSRVLVSGAPKELVLNYTALFAQSGIVLQSLETEAFGLIRSLIGKDKSRVMIVDIGHDRTTVTIVQEGFPFLHRSIATGGNDVTKRIAQMMTIDLDEAEQVKRDLAEAESKEVPKFIIDALQPILHEMRYSLDLYAGQEFHSYNTVEKIIVTGGSAHLPYLDPYLSKALNINVYLGDPWARVSAPSGLRPALDENGPSFAVAIGLAMKGRK